MDALSPSVVSKEHDGPIKSEVHYHTDLPRYPNQLLTRGGGTQPKLG